MDKREPFYTIGGHVNWCSHCEKKGFAIGGSGKEPTCQCRSHRDMGSVSGSERSLGRGHGNPLQYSCLENPMVREAWWAIVYRVT